MGVVVPLVNHKSTGNAYIHLATSCITKSGSDILHYFTKTAVTQGTTAQVDALTATNFISLYSNFGHSNYDLNTNAQTTEWVTKPWDLHPALQCHEMIANDKIHGVTANSATSGDTRYFKNCMYYIQDAADEYTCLKCPDNSQPSTVKKIDDGTGNFVHYLGDCSQTCSSFGYTAIPPYWKKFLSCPHCVQSSTSDNIPVVVYRAIDESYEFKSWEQFDLAESTQKYLNVASTSDRNIVCMDNKDDASVANFFSNTASADLVAMPNCAMAFFDLNLQKASGSNPDGTTIYTVMNSDWNNGTYDKTLKMHLLCGACKPGFKATHFTDNTPFVSACTAISQCNTQSGINKMFNGCS